MGNNGDFRPPSPAEQIAILEMYGRLLTNTLVGAFLRDPIDDRFDALVIAAKASKESFEGVNAKAMSKCPKGTKQCGPNECCVPNDP